jgi:hypothetical protein
MAYDPMQDEILRRRQMNVAPTNFNPDAGGVNGFAPSMPREPMGPMGPSDDIGPPPMNPMNPTAGMQNPAYFQQMQDRVAQNKMRQGMAPTPLPVNRQAMAPPVNAMAPPMGAPPPMDNAGVAPSINPYRSMGAPMGGPPNALAPASRPVGPPNMMDKVSRGIGGANRMMNKIKKPKVNRPTGFGGQAMGPGSE